MICPNCQRETEEGRFCSICGAPLPETAKAAGINKKKVLRRIVIGVICVAVIALGGYQIAGRIRHQRVTPKTLEALVSSTEDTVALVEDYFELYFSKAGLPLGINQAIDFQTELEKAENRVVREEIFLRQVYEDDTSRKGWDSNKYADYEALYEACRDLCDFVGSYDYQDPDGVRQTYDALMRVYQDCLRRVS